MANSVIAYLNGAFLPLEKAQVSPMDRGFLFGDGVYEVIPVYKGKAFCLKEHIERLNQSLQGIRMKPVLSLDEWAKTVDELIQKNNIPDQWLYIQITRGNEGARNHKIPQKLEPTVFAVCFPKKYPTKEEVAQGMRVSAVKDIRWKLCNIKTTARVAYVLMYQEAADAGFDEAIIFQNGYALEGTSSNVFIVRHGVIITPPKGPQILSGITRDKILAIAEKHKIPYKECKISERDLSKSDECWVTSSVRGLAPVIECDGAVIGNGKAGPMWGRMWDLLEEEIAGL